MNENLKKLLYGLLGLIIIGIIYYVIFKLVFKNLNTTYVGPVVLLGVMAAFIKTLTGPKKSNNNPFQNF